MPAWVRTTILPLAGSGPSPAWDSEGGDQGSPAKVHPERRLHGAAGRRFNRRLDRPPYLFRRRISLACLAPGSGSLPPTRLLFPFPSGSPAGSTFLSISLVQRLVRRNVFHRTHFCWSMLVNAGGFCEAGQVRYRFFHGSDPISPGALPNRSDERTFHPSTCAS